MDRRTLLTSFGAGAMAAGLAGCISAGAAAGAGRRADVSDGVAPGFEGVRDAFLAAQAGDPGGAQLCVYRHGRRVVDLWAGKDLLKDRPYGPDTLTMIMSGTKGVTAIAAHLLAQRGQLDLFAPVARYWPEFAAEDKQDIPVAFLLSHKAGLSDFPPGFNILDTFDWEKTVSALAAMKPMWKPGSAVQYHAATFGYLVGEVVRRITGKSVGQFVADEFAGPLDLDLWIGNLPEEAEARYAPQFEPPPRPMSAQNERLNSRAAHIAESPAVNGICNARSLAKFYAAVIGEVDGLRILDDVTIARASLDQTTGMPAPDMKSLAGSRYSLGFNLRRAAIPYVSESSFGHSGAGGRLGFADPPSGLAVAYVCNNMAWNPAVADPRWTFLDALRKAASIAA